MLTEHQLVLFNRRDPKIFDVVFRHHYGHINLYLYSILKHEIAAEYMTMNVFMELLKPSAPFNTADNIKAWLFRKAKNRCLDFDKTWIKQKALNRNLMDQSYDPDMNDAQLQYDRLAIDALITIIKELPNSYNS